MKIQLAMLTVLVLLFGMSGCGSLNPRGKTFMMRAGATGYPKPSELKSLERRSLRGDVKASIALAQFYDREKGDRLAAQPYYLRAAQQGNAACMHNYAMGELWYVAFQAIEAAEEWAAKAKAHGGTYADSPLELSRKLMRVYYPDAPLLNR